MKKIKEVLIQRVSHIRKQELPEPQNGSGSKRNRMRFRIALKRKLRAAKVVPALPYMRVELYMEQAKEVSAVRYYNVATTGYPVCPNCGYAMEREYQKYCEVCGQLLGWKKFIRDEVTVQRITGPGLVKESFLKPKNLSKDVAELVAKGKNDTKTSAKNWPCSVR